MKKDIYKEVTDNIIEALEQVDIQDYKEPFAQLTSQMRPINPMTSSKYNGINILILWIIQMKHGYLSNEWGTFKQWKEKGANVKKGEKSTTIIFYKRVEKKDNDNKDDDESKYYNLLKSYNVFNADQVEGYEPTTGLENGNFGKVGVIEEIEKFVSDSGAKVVPNQDTAYFNFSEDSIGMPNKDVFYETSQTATENYYAVLLHELTHWTGGNKRLDREQVGFKSGNNCDKYAFEELIAELGSAFLCSQFGIKQHGYEDHAIYLKSWLKALKSDKKYIFKAAAQAQKAVDYLNKKAGIIH